VNNVLGKDIFGKVDRCDDHPQVLLGTRNLAPGSYRPKLEAA
jgi:hypothetical protein